MAYANPDKFSGVPDEVYGVVLDTLGHGAMRPMSAAHRRGHAPRLAAARARGAGAERRREAPRVERAAAAEARRKRVLLGRADGGDARRRHPAAAERQRVVRRRAR